MTTTPNTPAIRSSATSSGALVPVEVDKLAIVGIRRDGGALVVIESDPKGAREHRCITERELWLTLTAIADRHGAQIVDGKQGSPLKKERERLSEAFGVLIKKGRAHAAERVGEDTVGAVETIGEVVGKKAVAGLRRISTHGSSTLGRTARGLPPAQRGGRR